MDPVPAVKNYPPWVDVAYSHSKFLCDYTDWSQDELKRIIFNSYAITEEKKMKYMKIPQRTPKWYRIRNGRVKIDKKKFRGVLVSSSVVPKILGHEGSFRKIENYKSGEQNRFDYFLRTQRGTAVEPFTEEECTIIIQAHVGNDVIVSPEEVGIQLHVLHPFMAASVDVWYNFSCNRTLQYWNGAMEMKARGAEHNEPYEEVPWKYHDQVAHSMFVTGLKEYWFSCHAFKSFSLQLFEFDEESWSRSQKIVEEWYWKNYWPTLVLFHLDNLHFEEGDENAIKIDPNADEDTNAQSIFNWALENKLDYHLATNAATKRRKLAMEDDISDMNIDDFIASYS